MKYGQFAIKNKQGQFIKYPTAYRAEPEYTNSLYDVHLWNSKEDAEKLTKNTGLKVVMV